MKKIISYLSIATWVLGVFSLWFSLTNDIWTDFQKLGFVAQSVGSKGWLEMILMKGVNALMRGICCLWELNHRGMRGMWVV